MKPLINDYISFIHSTKTKNMNILRNTWQDKARISRQAWFSFFPRKKYNICAYYNYSCLKYMNNSLKWQYLFLGWAQEGHYKCENPEEVKESGHVLKKNICEI